MKIEIQINNMYNNLEIYIDYDNNKIKINNIKKDISRDKIDYLIRIIRTWKSTYENNFNMVDREKFRIKVITDEGIDTFEGNGTYPDNYNLFKDWISDINE